MNERIKLLAEQAGMTNDKFGMYFAKDFDSHCADGVDLEKFAELIVGECMRMCDVAAIGYESHGHMKEANGCYSAKEYIKEHFGVE